MKKFLFSIVLLFISLVTPSIYVKASYLPPTLPDTSVVPDFLQNVAQYQIVNDTNTYLPKTDLNAVNQIVNGRSIENSIQYTYLDNASLSAELGTIYDINGVEVNQNDTYTVYGVSDIGPFMCICAKGTGEILYQGETNSLHSTLLGGEGLKETFPEFIVRDLTGAGGALDAYNNIKNAVDEARLDSMIIYGNSLTASDKEFLSDYTFYFRMQTSFGWSVYVPNACSTSVLVKDDSGVYSYHGSVPVGNPRNMQPVIYTSDPSQVYFNGTGNAVGLKRETNSVWGTSFSYCSVYRNSYAILYNGGVLDMNLPTQSQFNQYKSISNDAYYLAPVDDVDNEPEDNIYNYTYVTVNPPTTNRYVNNNYNYEGDTNYNNYPVYYNYEYPTYPTTNAYTTNIYNYYTTPQIGGDVGTIDPEDVTDGIPILNNLRYRFPFSIPFDIYDLISGLSVQREAPHFEWEVYFPVIDYTWNIDFDLSAWDQQAEIFRTCFLILFVIALGMWAYSHFFGS